MLSITSLLIYNVMEIIDSFGDILRNYPALAVFLTVGMGFLLGRLRIGSFTLGSVTAVLLVGVVVGQFGITVSGPLKTVFFLMFLFFDRLQCRA